MRTHTIPPPPPAPPRSPSGPRPDIEVISAPYTSGLARWLERVGVGAVRFVDGPTLFAELRRLQDLAAASEPPAKGWFGRA